jgi:hypothetical protein
MGMAAIQPTLPLAGAEAGTVDPEALRKCCCAGTYERETHGTIFAELTESPGPA